MKRRFKIALAFTTLISATVPAAAHDYTSDELKIEHPWSRATPVSAPVAGGYLKITNLGSMPETFLGGTSPVASGLEVHESTIKDGIARMRPLTDGLKIEPGKTVELIPGKTHLMFIKPNKLFKEGDKIQATLRFQNAGDVNVEFAVQGIGSTKATVADHANSPSAP